MRKMGSPLRFVPREVCLQSNVTPSLYSLDGFLLWVCMQQPHCIPWQKGDFKQLQFITERLCEKLLWKIFDRTQWPLLARMMT
jgi:hypothetical protein